MNEQVRFEAATAGGRTGKYVDILEDGAFKVIFGPQNKPNMINLLRAILGRDISDIEYIDTEKHGLTPRESRSAYDLSVLFPDGSRCVVEMQKTNLRYFNYRAMFYSSHLIQLQASLERERQHKVLKEKDDRPFWDYHFPPVYVIGILQRGSHMLDRELDAHSAKGYLFQYRNTEINCGADMKVDVNFIFLSLDRFDKTAGESVSLLDQFAYSLKHMKDQEGLPDTFDGDEMKTLYHSSYTANLTAEQAHLIEINDNMTTENDILVAIAEAREMAAIEGREQGLAKGRAEGHEQGLAEGRAEGIREANRQTAANFKKLGVSVDDIVKATGLTKEEVERL